MFGSPMIVSVISVCSMHASVSVGACCLVANVCVVVLRKYSVARPSIDIVGTVERMSRFKWLMSMCWRQSTINMCQPQCRQSEWVGVVVVQYSELLGPQRRSSKPQHKSHS